MSDILVWVVPVGWRQDDVDEPPIVEFPAASDSIIETLNDFDECDFTIPLDAVTLEELELGTHEVIIFYRSRCWWMRPLWETPDLAANQTTIHCQGLETWFAERVLYEAVDNNIGHNMDFELDEVLQNPGAVAWLTSGETTTTAATLDATRIDTDWMVGEHCAQLVGTSDTQYSYMYQNASTDLRPGVELADVEGQKVYMSAWYKILSTGLTEWQGPPPAGIQFQTHTDFDEADDMQRVASAPLDPASAAHDEWTRIEISEGIRVLPDVVGVNWFVASVPGTILWDNIRVTTDPVIIMQVGYDVAHVISHLSRYAQNTLPEMPFPSIKTDLFIGYNPDPIGVAVHRVFHLYDRTSIWDIFQQYIDRDDGVDVWIEVDCDTGERTIRSAGEKGATKTSAVLEVGVTVDRGGTGLVDARKGTNAMVVTSSFSGPAGEYGWANTLDEDDVVQGWGGNLRERVISAPSDVPVDSLMGIAASELDIHAVPEVIPEITGSARRLLDDPDYDLQTGDVVPYSVAQGRFTYDFNIRIASLRINPKADKVTVIPLAAQRGHDSTPDLAKSFRNLSTRLDALELARAAQPFERPVVKEYVEWGLEALDTIESPVLPTGIGTLDHFFVKLRVASSSGDVVVDAKIDGSVVATVTVAAGDTQGYSAKVGAAVAHDTTFVSYEITSTGTDAAGILCSGRIY